MTTILTQALNDKILRLINAVNNDSINDVMDVTNGGRSLDVINGIPINVNGQQQFSALHTAVELNRMDILQDLLEMGADPDIGAVSNIYYPALETTFGVTPLFIAIYMANLKAVKLLLTNGADINHHIQNYPSQDIGDYYETIYLSFALSIAPQEPVEIYNIVDYILTNHQPKEDIYKTVEYPTIIGTIEQGLYELVELLLEKYIYANPNEIELDPQNSMSLLERRNALMVAIGFSPESNQLVDILLRRGANPNNNIGFEYTIQEVLHPETLHENDYYRQSHDFYRAKDDIEEAITGFVTNYNSDPNSVPIGLATALNYALAVQASNVIVTSLITHGGLTMSRILHNEGLIIATGPSSFQQLNQHHIQKILNIPNIAPEQYKDCVDQMGTGEILSDFITAEDVPIENTVILPSSNDNNKTCMDRMSYSNYIISKLNNHQPITHPFTRERINNAPNYQTWYDTNYPLGLSVNYNSFRTDNNTTRGGRRKRSKSKQTRTKHGKGPATSRLMQSVHVWNELRKDAEVIRNNMNILMQSSEIFDQYRGKMMEQLPEKVQQRMSKYSSLVVPMIDFLLDLYTLQSTGSQNQFPIDIITLNTQIVDFFRMYPFLVVIGSRSPVEGYDFMTKIQDMEREIQKKSGGKRRKTTKKKHRNKKKKSTLRHKK